MEQPDGRDQIETFVLEARILRQTLHEPHLLAPGLGQLVAVLEHRRCIVQANDLGVRIQIAVGKCALAHAAAQIQDAPVILPGHALCQRPAHAVIVVPMHEKGADHPVIEDAGVVPVIAARLSVNLQIAVVTGHGQRRIQFQTAQGVGLVIAVEPFRDPGLLAFDDIQQRLEHLGVVVALEESAEFVGRGRFHQVRHLLHIRQFATQFLFMVLVELNHAGADARRVIGHQAANEIEPGPFGPVGFDRHGIPP